MIAQAGAARLARRVVPALAALVLAAPPVAAQREESATGDRGTDMLIDLVLVRPIGIATTVVGAAAFVISLPFTIPTGTVGDAARELVVKPAEYTFDRPLGDRHHCGADRHPCGLP